MSSKRIVKCDGCGIELAPGAELVGVEAGTACILAAGEADRRAKLAAAAGAAPASLVLNNGGRG